MMQCAECSIIGWDLWRFRLPLRLPDRQCRMGPTTQRRIAALRILLTSCQIPQIHRSLNHSERAGAAAVLAAAAALEGADDAPHKVCSAPHSGRHAVPD